MELSNEFAAVAFLPKNGRYRRSRRLDRRSISARWRTIGMSVAQNYAQTFLSAGVSHLPSTATSDDPVTLRLRESARRMVGIAVFSGVINLLMLSGSLYMLQVYDRVIPSRNIATLLGLSLIVLLAYLVQGLFRRAAHAHAVPGGDPVRR